MNQRPEKHLKPITHHLETIQTTLLLLSSYFIYTLLLFPLTSSLNTFVFIFILTMSKLYLARIVWHDSFLYISFVFWFTFDRTRHQLDLIGSAQPCCVSEQVVSETTIIEKSCVMRRTERIMPKLWISLILVADIILNYLLFDMFMILSIMSPANCPNCKLSSLLKLRSSIWTFDSPLRADLWIDDIWLWWIRRICRLESCWRLASSISVKWLWLISKDLRLKDTTSKKSSGTRDMKLWDTSRSWTRGGWCRE